MTQADEYLSTSWDDHAYWSRSNMAEAIPGVCTPFNWSIWGPVGERSIRWSFYAIGALERHNLDIPRETRERCLGIFEGRPAAKIDFFCRMGDRIPGASGAMIADQFLGKVPEGLTAERTTLRYPLIACRLANLAPRIPAKLVEAARITDIWWRSEIACTPNRDLAALTRQMVAGMARMTLSIGLTGEAAFAGAQPVHDLIGKLADSVGRPELAGRVVAGLGKHVETKFVADLWALSREQLTLSQFLGRYGYHGPLEGEASTQVWREDPGPVLSLCAQYARRGDDAAPDAVGRAAARAGAQATRELLDLLPLTRRSVTRALLRAARSYLPLRGIGKIPFLQSMDVIRAAARRTGQLLAEQNCLDNPEDVFFLTLSEVKAGHHPSWRDLISERQAAHAAYTARHLPMSWRGWPQSTTKDVLADKTTAKIELAGLGASPGVVEARVRVITNPLFDDVEEGEILVATTTDPSWASVIFLASALVTDIGGAMSHAAIVSREMGVPCVMGTNHATRLLRTGDICRVNGNTGTVELVRRATVESLSTTPTSDYPHH